MKVSRPLLNYFGGKWRLAPWIIDKFQDHKIYCEPFGGSLSILLRKERSNREIVNDIDKELFNLYQIARDHGDELKRRLSLTPHSREEYRLSMTSDDLDKVEMARRTIVRCYFGIGDSFLHNHNAFRTSKTSNTCVAISWKNFHESFNKIIERLQGVTLENLTYESMFNKYDSLDTLWYLDPPYPKFTRSRKHGGYRKDWDDNDHVKFLNQVKSLNGKVIISSYRSDLYDQELSGWDKYFKVSTTNGATKRMEVLYIK